MEIIRIISIAFLALFLYMFVKEKKSDIAVLIILAENSTFEAKLPAHASLHISLQNEARYAIASIFKIISI